MTAEKSTRDETARFHDAIRAGEWGDAADMVREHVDPGTTLGLDSTADRLADWLAEGDWDGAETPEQIAREWESI